MLAPDTCRSLSPSCTLVAAFSGVAADVPCATLALAMGTTTTGRCLERVQGTALSGGATPCRAHPCLPRRGAGLAVDLSAIGAGPACSSSRLHSLHLEGISTDRTESQPAVVISSPWRRMKAGDCAAVAAAGQSRRTSGPQRQSKPRLAVHTTGAHPHQSTSTYPIKPHQEDNVCGCGLRGLTSPTPTPRTAAS